MAQDNNDKKKLTGGQQTAIGACIAAACLIAAPLAEKWEGYAPKVYKDPANISTWCYGETLVKLSNDPTFIYSKDQCAVLLRQREARDYAPKILACLPQLQDPKRRYVFGALIDASYNAGPVAVCKSPMAIQIRADHWLSACSALPSWYVHAQKRVNGKRVGAPFLVKGLINRRTDEKKVCLTPVAG